MQKKGHMDWFKNMTVRDLLGPIGQFITNLLGKHGDKWWNDFLLFLKKSLVEFKVSQTFDYGYMADRKHQPVLIPLSKLYNEANQGRPGIPAASTALMARNLRPATTEELLASVCHLKIYELDDVGVVTISSIRQSRSGPADYCAVLISINHCKTSICILDSSGFGELRLSTKLLTFPRNI